MKGSQGCQDLLDFLENLQVSLLCIHKHIIYNKSITIEVDKSLLVFICLFHYFFQGLNGLDGLLGVEGNEGDPVREFFFS